jgi:hypothetical protein
MYIVDLGLWRLWRSGRGRKVKEWNVKRAGFKAAEEPE